MIRVIYTLQVREGKREALVGAWREIVGAHAQDGGAKGSMLLQGEEPGQMVAISRWASRAAWERGRRDDVHPRAYEVFRGAATVVSKRVLEEVEVIGGE